MEKAGKIRDSRKREFPSNDGMKNHANGVRMIGMICILLMASLSLSPLSELFISEAGGEKYMPPIHDSTSPSEEEWVLVAYRALEDYIDEETSESTSEYSYIACYAKKVADLTFVFRFEWKHSPFVLVRARDEDFVPDQYAFCGAIHYHGYEDEPLWEVGPVVASSGTSYGSKTSGQIEVSGELAIYCSGFLIAHADIPRSKWELAGCVALSVGIGCVCGAAVVATGGGIAAAAVFGALAGGGSFAVGWWASGTNNRYVEYHSCSGCFLQYYFENPWHKIRASCSPSSETTSDTYTGYDLTNGLEALTGRRDLGNASITVQCLYPTKIHIDFNTLYKNNYHGEYDDQAETKILMENQQWHYTIMGGYPDNPDNGGVEILENGKRAEMDWDLTKYYFLEGGSRGLGSKDFRNNVKSLRDTSMKKYWKGLGDVPVIEFTIQFQLDYELPDAMMNENDPSGTVHQYQLPGFYIDYYTTGAHDHTHRVKVADLHYYLDVYNGDSQIPAMILMPLIPIFIAQGILAENGILIDLPGDVSDVFILPPNTFEGLLTYLPDPGMDPAYKVPTQDDILKQDPVFRIKVPDPENTIILIPDPGISPASAITDPVTDAVDYYEGLFGENVELYRNLVYESREFYLDLIWGNIDLYQERIHENVPHIKVDAREYRLLGIEPGDPDPDDTLIIKIHDLQSRYQILLETPDSTYQELVTINPPSDQESGSIALKNDPAFVIIPGSEDFIGDTGTTTITCPVEEDGTMIKVGIPDTQSDSLSMISLPWPEEHTIIDFNTLGIWDEDGNHDHWITISLQESDTTEPVRSFQESIPGFSEATLCLGNFVTVDTSGTTITTYDTTHPFISTPMACCYLDPSPDSTLCVPSPGDLIFGSDPATPSFSITDNDGFTNPIFEVILSSSDNCDNEIGLLVPEETTASDGVLIRGLSTIPSSNYYTLHSWIVSSEEVHYDFNLHTNPWNGMQIHNIQELEPDVATGPYDHMIHHPGQDGVFYSTGTNDSDALYLQTYGVGHFIANARAETDDLFYTDQFIIDDVDININFITESQGSIQVNGDCTRLDGVRLEATLDDGDDHIAQGIGYVMFNEYSINIDSSNLPSGLYTLTVNDLDSNSEQLSVEVNNDGSR